LIDANLQAVIRMETWLYASIDAYQTIGVKTVLSTGKYRKLVETAKANGFEFNLIYVYPRTVEMNIQRVRARFQKGGHDVPEDKIRERRIKSFEQFEWFFNAADNAIVLDNSEAELRIVASKANGTLFLGTNILPEIASVVSKFSNSVLNFRR